MHKERTCCEVICCLLHNLCKLGPGQAIQNVGPPPRSKLFDTDGIPERKKGFFFLDLGGGGDEEK